MKRLSHANHVQLEAEQKLQDLRSESSGRLYSIHTLLSVHVHLLYTQLYLLMMMLSFGFRKKSA